MRPRFDQQLEELNLELIKMGSLCERGIRKAVDLLMEENTNASIKDVDIIEEEINQKERDIETLCMRLLLQQQPVATDLRNISSALKMAEFVKVQEIAHKIHIGEMAEAAIKMVTGSIDSFVKRDLEAAKEVVKSDDIVDNLFLKVKGELPELMQKDAKNAEYYIDLIMIAKYLERIGDHAENIAQWVEYSITGVHEALGQE